MEFWSAGDGGKDLAAVEVLATLYHLSSPALLALIPQPMSQTHRAGVAHAAVYELSVLAAHCARAAHLRLLHGGAIPGYLDEGAALGAAADAPRATRRARAHHLVSRV